MGMIGQYIAVSPQTLQDITEGKTEIHDIEVGLDIDKAWQVLHYVLCGDIVGGEPPLGYIVPMGCYIGEFSDMPLFAVSPDQLREAVAAIEPLTADDLKRQYNYAELLEEEVYPVMPDEDPEELFDYIFSNFAAIREFYAQAAAKEQTVLFYVS
ncbi:hypothetical protein GCM10010912_56170 [Paenibacillus albidus]|uniref:DUF1877 family protein n=1 Tax=Paenibacillus albidus TaxID=2041023 RepID=A0A917D068_9BACL|nr:YfbM family protein [Paenibacillus albidus]GGG04207.1 hypothetical protein GCM10010912_56170 [Paenibacillus albidus]